MMHLKIREIYALSEKRNSGECRLFWILVHLGPRRCVGPREIRLAPHLRGGEHEERQGGERIVLVLDVQVCDQDEPADDGLVPDAGFARTRAGNAITTITPPRQHQQRRQRRRHRHRAPARRTMRHPHRHGVPSARASCRPTRSRSAWPVRSAPYLDVAAKCLTLLSLVKEAATGKSVQPESKLRRARLARRVLTCR